tara:strand:- start:147 stop:464 length:318 start_codon:yes stop_codon:yes gene_type:complete
MNKQYKIVIPKAGQSEKDGGIALYEMGRIVTADESWKKDLMESFVSSGWAMEVKMQDTSDMVRARTSKGHFVPDDPSTPEVNEAFVETKVVKKKAAPRKKAAPKK